MEDDISAIPTTGWTVSMAHKFTQKRVQRMRPTIIQAIKMIPLSLRYLCYYIYLWFRGRSVVMDFFKLAQSNVKRGVPLGGIGCGTVGRSFLGDFCNFQMVPGFYEYSTCLADQFIVTIMNDCDDVIYQKVLCVKDKAPNILKAWDWDFPAEDGEYTALYPRSWYTYNIKEHSIKLICRQINPVIPRNYKDSCIPGAVFVWTVINKNSFPIKISLTFTFKNGVGSKSDQSGIVESEFFDNNNTELDISGISIKQEIGGVPCCYSIACIKKDINSISRTPYFNPSGSGKTVWNHLRMHGELKADNRGVKKKNVELAVALCSRFDVPSNTSKSTEFCLVWDMPFAKFPFKNDMHLKFYTKFFKSDGSSGPDIAFYCLQNFKNWEKSIFDWQKPILENNTLPSWYKHALFNELYYISDGGSLWLLPFKYDKFKLDDPRTEYGHFSYLEGQEYRMYNTYDVHFYASFALTMLWPKLQMSLQYDFSDAINVELSERVWYLDNGECAERKKKGTVPHDIGDPGEEPFVLINSYPVHDVSEWRDLNLKFVLQVYRDFMLHQDINYLIDMFPQIKTVMAKSLTFDKDNDGMIENSGSADQTYDCWVMSGTSSYCGSLWLGALHATIQIANLLGYSEISKKYNDILENAKESFERKLWNGKYYNFDCSSGENHISIMADQLCGIWYLKCSDPKFYLLPESNIKLALMTIYGNNVLKYFDGQQGAVNGMMPNGNVDRYSIQSEEMWTGVTYSLSSLLISEGFIKEGFKTAEGLINTIYNKSQLGFASPEALHGTDEFRSLGYMRPLSIWSIQLALDHFNNLAVTRDNSDKTE